MGKILSRIEYYIVKKQIQVFYQGMLLEAGSHEKEIAQLYTILGLAKSYPRLRGSSERSTVKSRLKVSLFCSKNKLPQLWDFLSNLTPALNRETEGLRGFASSALQN